MFVVTVVFKYVPEHAAEFRKATLEQAANSLALEPDCHVFEVCFSSDDDCQLFLYEKYTDKAAFDVHLASDHFKTFNALVSPWVADKTVDTWFFQEGSK